MLRYFSHSSQFQPKQGDPSEAKLCKHCRFPLFAHIIALSLCICALRHVFVSVSKMNKLSKKHKQEKKLFFCHILYFVFFKLLSLTGMKMMQRRHYFCYGFAAFLSQPCHPDRRSSQLCLKQKECEKGLQLYAQAEK